MEKDVKQQSLQEATLEALDNCLEGSCNSLNASKCIQ